MKYGSTFNTTQLSWPGSDYPCGSWWSHGSGQTPWRLNSLAISEQKGTLAASLDACKCRENVWRMDREQDARDEERQVGYTRTGAIGVRNAASQQLFAPNTPRFGSMPV